jgi:hypothetical protein
MTNWCFNCNGEVCTSVLCLYTIVALPDEDRSYRPKHVAVNVMSK